MSITHKNLPQSSKNLHPVAKNDTPLWYFCTEMLINTHPQTFEIWFGMSIFVRCKSNKAKCQTIALTNKAENTI